MKYFMIAGEPSGDLHGSSLMNEIRKQDDAAVFRGMGGAKMKHSGLDMVADIADNSIMGFWEVLIKIWKIKTLIDLLKSSMLQFQPDKVILIDYGGLNLRMARFAKSQNLEVHYYIPPKVWAWNEKRVHKIRKYTDQAYVIFPFEEEYFRKHNVAAHYVGNPVVQLVEDFQRKYSESRRLDNQIALLPGSRPQEIRRMLPVMLAMTPRFRNYQFVVAATNEQVIATMNLPENVKIVADDTYEVLRTSRIAVVTSGTANLEAALLDTPQIVVYKANPISYFIARNLIKVRYISPVNLILDKLVCTELIQNKFNAVDLEREVENLLMEENASRVMKGYGELRKQLGEKDAAFEAARSICN